MEDEDLTLERQRLQDLDEAMEEPPGAMRLDHLVHLHYQTEFPQPWWQLAQDLQDQAFIYSNVVERLKSGDTAGQIRRDFEDAGLTPQGLPNPVGEKLLRHALKKISKYRAGLIELVNHHRMKLLAELDMANTAVGLTVVLGLPPGLQVSVEYQPQP